MQPAIKKKRMVERYVVEGSLVFTDSLKSYHWLSNRRSKFVHRCVNHSICQNRGYLWPRSQSHHKQCGGPLWQIEEIFPAARLGSSGQKKLRTFVGGVSLATEMFSFPQRLIQQPPG